MEGTLFSVGGVEWGCMGHYFGWVGVGEKISWLGGYEWASVQCLIMPAANLAKMESLFSKIKNIKYLLCVIDVFTNYAWLNL